MMLPDELEWVLEMLGYNWPTADEDKLRECAALWRRFGDDVTALHVSANTSATTVVAHNSGESIDAFTKAYAKFDGGSGSDGYLANAAQAAHLIANVLDACSYIVVFAKWAVIAQLIALAIEIAAAQAAAPFTFGLSEVGALGATQVTRLIVRRLLDELKDALIESIVEAMKEPVISAVEAIITDLVRQSVNVGFGAQQGYDLGQTVKAGTDAGWEAVKQTPQSLVEGVRDSLGQKAGNRVHHAVDSRIDGHHGSGTESDGDGVESRDGSGDGQSDSSSTPPGDSGTSGSGTDSSGSGARHSDSDAGSGTDSGTRSGTDSGTARSNGGSISVDAGGADARTPDTGGSPDSRSGADSGSGPGPGQTPASSDVPAPRHTTTLPDFDDPPPGGTSPSPSHTDPSSATATAPGPTGTGHSSASGPVAPTPHTAPAHTSSDGTTPSSGGGISTSIDSLAASAPVQSHAAPAPTATDHSPVGTGGRTDGTSAAPASPAPPPTTGDGASPRSTASTPGTKPSTASPTSPTLAPAPSRNLSTSATPSTPSTTGTGPASTPNPTPGASPRTPRTSVQESRVPGPGDGRASSAGAGRATGTGDGRTPGATGGRTFGAANGPIPTQRTPGTTPGERTTSRGTPEDRMAPRREDRSTPRTDDRTTAPGTPTTRGRNPSPDPRTPTTSDPRTPTNRTAPPDSTPARDRPPNRPLNQSQTTPPHTSSGTDQNRTSVPGNNTPPPNSSAQPGPAETQNGSSRPGPQNQPNTRPSPDRSNQSAGTAPGTPPHHNAPHQPVSQHPTAQHPTAQTSTTGPDNRHDRQHGHVASVPIHTATPAPTSSAPPPHTEHAAPQPPDAPHAEPGTHAQQHPYQDSLNDIRGDLDHHPGGLTEPHPDDQQALLNAVPHHPDGTPQRFPDPFGHWSQLQNDGGNLVPGRSNNCADCSRSFLETWYGNPQVSAPRTLDVDAHGNLDPWSPEHNANDNQIRWSGAPHTYAGPGNDPNTPNRIAWDLQQAGHGAAAIVQVDWPNGGGHAFNAVNHHGNIIWIDTQSGEVSHQPLHIGKAEHVWHIPLDADRNPIHPTPPGTSTSEHATTNPLAGNGTSHEGPDNSTQGQENQQASHQAAPHQPGATSQDTAHGGHTADGSPEHGHPLDDPGRSDHPRLSEPETIDSTHYGMAPMEHQATLRETNDVRQVDLDPVHQHLNDWLTPVPDEDGGTRVPLVDAMQTCSPPRPDDPNHTPVILRHDDLARILPGFDDMHPGERGAVVASLARLSHNFHASHGVSASPEPTDGYPTHGGDAHGKALWNASHRDDAELRQAIEEEFGSSGIAGALRESGEHRPDFTGRNYAALEVYDPSSNRISYMVDSSYPNPGGGEKGKHSEENILDYLETVNEKRTDKDAYQPLSMYSDREPCGRGQGYANCADTLSKRVPGVDVFYGTGYRKKAPVIDPAAAPEEGYKQKFDKDLAQNLATLGKIWVRAMSAGGL